MQHRLRLAKALTPTLLAAGALCVPMKSGAQVTDSRGVAPGRTRYAILERTISEEMLSKGIPGVAVAVFEEGRVSYRHAFGIADVESGVPMTTELLVQIGSATKTVTALLANEMAARGEVSLDAPVARYVSGLPVRAGALTLRALLSQSSGLRDEAADSGRQDESALLQYARAMSDSAFQLPSGEAFSYSNLGFALAGLALQEAVHRPFAQLIDDRVVRPLTMGHATFRPMDAMTYPRAAGHATDPTGRLRVVRPVANDTRYWPAGYLWASGDDMALLLRLLLLRGQAGDVPATLAAAADSVLVSRMPVPGLPNDAQYGYGLFMDQWHGTRRAWHPGSMPGYSTLVEFLPDQRIGIVVLANRDGVRLDRIAETALETLTVLPGEQSPVTASGESPKETLLRSLEGVYVSRFPLELRFRDGHLVLKRFGVELVVTPLGENRYSVQPNVGAGARADVFRIVPAAGNRPAYIQMFLWAFPRVRA
ncbi:MAG: serine hydrolase domain-containing protein [Gemmatimonadaceae bacterium]